MDERARDREDDPGAAERTGSAGGGDREIETAERRIPQIGDTHCDTELWLDNSNFFEKEY